MYSQKNHFIYPLNATVDIYKTINKKEYIFSKTIIGKGINKTSKASNSKGFRKTGGTIEWE